MIALTCRDERGGRLHFDIDGESVHVVATCGQDDEWGRIEIVSMKVSVDDAEAWLSLMLDRVRKAKAVKP